jgi:sugar-specific transcriptional regulator TrmB
MDLEILRKVGLSEGEIRVYGALLESGLSPLNKIHEKTGIERRNIYDILNKLIERGMVSYVDENRRRTFSLANPQKIVSYLEEKELEIKKIKNEVNVIIPQIEERYNSKKGQIKAETFRGQDGIKAVWEEMLEEKAIYWIGSGNYVPDKFPIFFENWTMRRIKKKIPVYHLFRKDKKGETVERKMQQIKFLPEEFNGNPAATCIWGDKVGQFLFGEELFAFVIESKELAENYKKYHKYLWEKAAR